MNGTKQKTVMIFVLINWLFVINVKNLRTVSEIERISSTYTFHPPAVFNVGRITFLLNSIWNFQGTLLLRKRSLERLYSIVISKVKSSKKRMQLRCMRSASKERLTNDFPHVFARNVHLTCMVVPERRSFTPFLSATPANCYTPTRKQRCSQNIPRSTIRSNHQSTST